MPLGYTDATSYELYLEQQFLESREHVWHRIMEPASGHNFLQALGLYGLLAGPL